MKRRPRADFFLDLEMMDGFFADIDALIRQEALDAEKQKRYWERRARNLVKAQRIQRRMQLVRDYDIWKLVAHMEADFFGEWDERNARIKLLYAKKTRLNWVLVSLYNYWAFDYKGPGFDPKKGLTFSRICRQYDNNFETFKEKLKQEKWDRKRARVRARREARNDNLKGRAKKERDKKATAIATILKLKRGIIDRDTVKEITW